jgi:DNA helicase HerA-like ATPase
VPGLSQGRSRHLYADSTIPESGIAIATSTYPGRPRTLALRPEDLTLHAHIHGKTGTGKSNVIIHMAVRQMELGYGVGVIEPAGDLTEDLLRRIPRHRLSDVVLFEPAEAAASGYAVGFNIFAGTDNPEVLADQLMAIFHGIYHDTGIYAQ